MIIDSNTYSIPGRPAVASSDGMVEEQSLTTLEQTWNSLSQYYSSRTGMHSREGVLENEIHNLLMKGRVEIETMLTNYDLLARGVLAVKECHAQDSPGTDHDQDIRTCTSLKTYCLDRCVHILLNSIRVYRQAMTDQKEKERTLHVLRHFDVRIDNSRILVNKRDCTDVCIDSADVTGSMARMFGISRRVVITCAYGSILLRMVRVVNDVDEMRKRVFMASRRVVSGGLTVSIDEIDDNDNNTDNDTDNVNNNIDNDIDDSNNVNDNIDNDRNDNNDRYTNNDNNINDNNTDNDNVNDSTVSTTSVSNVDRISKAVCTFLYHSLINNADTSVVVHKAYRLLSLYVAMVFFKGRQFEQTEYASGKTCVIFYVCGNDKVRIEIVNDEEIRGYYNEGRIVI